MMAQLGLVINYKNKALVKAIGEHIRELRTAKNISQLELANEAEVPLSQIGRIERGEGNPTVSSLFIIADALGVELKELIDVKFKRSR
jgi:transcriptional regulator with XRE-family HTH domain